jgi:hypothetical protein
MCDGRAGQGGRTAVKAGSWELCLCITCTLAVLRVQAIECRLSDQVDVFGRCRLIVEWEDKVGACVGL